MKIRIRLYVIIFTFGFVKCAQAQLLNKIEPDSVRNDKIVELRMQFSQFNFNKNLKPLIYFTTPYIENEERRTISQEYFTVLNDSTIKYTFNPINLRLNDTILDINIQSLNSKGFNEYISWRNALKVHNKPNYNNIKLIVENLPDSSKTNPKNYPSNVSVRVKYPNKNSHFTHNSNKVIIRGNTRSFIIPDSFTVINDSLMDVFFTLNDKIEKGYYSVEIENDVAFKLNSNSFLNLNDNDIRIYYYNMYGQLPNVYQIGDTVLKYEFYVRRKIEQPLNIPNQFNLEAYLNNAVAKNITIKLDKIKVDTFLIAPTQKMLSYTISYKVNIDSNTKTGIYSFNFHNDSIGNNWFSNIFKINPPKIEINESLNFPGSSGTILVYCGNKIPFKVPTNFRFLKNNLPTNHIKIDTFYYSQNITNGFLAYINYTSLPESNGKYDIELTNENIDTIIVPQILTVSEYSPYLLTNKNYIFNKGDTLKNMVFEMPLFANPKYNNMQVQNIKPITNGIETNEITIDSIRGYHSTFYSAITTNITINKTARSGWYDLSFDTAKISRNFIQKSAFYICDKEIKSFTPAIIAGSGQMIIDFTVNFSNTNFTKAKYMFLKIEDPINSNNYTVINFNVINDTTVIYKIALHNEYIDTTRFLPILVYNDYDGYIISRNKLQIEIAPSIVSIEPNWAEKERYNDIYFHTKLTSLTQLNPQFISPIFYKNNTPTNDIWVISRTVTNDSTLKVTLFPNTNTDGEYEIGIYQNQNNVTYTNRKKFSVSKTSNHNIDFNIDFSVYPNPTSNILNVQLNGYKNNPFSIQIIDLAGKIFYETNKPIVTLDLNSILTNKGMYFISLRNKNGEVTKKFVFN